MAADPSQMPSFSRGSAVLEYWLVHAEGLVVQPLGARVELVVVGLSAGRAETLIVRSRVLRRRKTIPAAAIAAVEPSTGRLLLDEGQKSRPVRARRSAGAAALAAWRRTRAAAATASRRTRIAAAAVLAWLSPRLAEGAAAVASFARLAVARAVQGIEWLAPRIERGLVRLWREARRATVLASENVRASLEAHRAERARRDDAARNVELPRPRPRR